MSILFEKLNLKSEKEIVLLNPPRSFEAEVKTLKHVRIVRRTGAALQFSFALVFVTTRAAVDRLSKALAAAARDDAILWFAYPKGTSKRYQCDFNRDNGWDVIRKAGWDTVRQVAIDADWSALRFRRREFIKSRA